MPPCLNSLVSTLPLTGALKWGTVWTSTSSGRGNMKMQPRSGPLGSTLPLTGALKWGTVWTSTSTGTGIMKGQS